MISNALTGFNKQRLRWWLLLFFCALALPTGVLIYQAYSQLKWAAFHQSRLQAESLAKRIDNRFSQLILTEENRSYTDYSFLVIAGDPAANFFQRSALSSFPVNSEIPGLIGYFQVDPAGRFTTPLLPAEGVEVGRYGISKGELVQRRLLQQRLLNILSDNSPAESGQGEELPLLATAPSSARQTLGSSRGDGVLDDALRFRGNSETDNHIASSAESLTEEAEVMAEQVVSQAAFDRLNQRAKSDAAKVKSKARGLTESKRRKTAPKLGRVEDLKLDYGYPQAAQDEALSMPLAPAAPVKRSLRKESSVLPEPQVSVADETGFETSQAPARPLVRIHTFESEVDRFEFGQLDRDHLIIFRKVWREGVRTIQGAVIDQQQFVHGVVEPLFNESAISQMSDLVLAFQGNVVTLFDSRQSRDYLSSARDLTGTLLSRTRLSNPLGEMELIFSVTRMPPGPGSLLIGWISVILILILSGGLYLLYRLGVRQIELTRQQQDFVSAVSHELKTPLTSIRMYGEILREGWASEAKRRSYYDYIYEESERLSRLISNVLQLARMTRNELKVEMRPVSVSELLDSIRSKISSQVERAGFSMRITPFDGEAESRIQIDPDSFSQIIINLVDNAIKFSTNSDNKKIEIACKRQMNGTIQFSVRDFGPGIPKGQMKKIFKLFYRSENELTRETIGTGIGLALVNQLATAMKGRVDVVNREPGAEFQVSFRSIDFS
ncbi:MAG: sensor histidine kinase [Gammaproteobacteria bacterium]|nr:sensor histidine kinase [Gammaproteobacteria bacterium]